MRPNELLYRVNNLVLEHRRALRDPHCEIIEFLGIGPYPLAVKEEEYEQSGYGDSFVPALKRMILDQEIKESTGLGNKGRVQGLTRK